MSVFKIKSDLSVSAADVLHKASQYHSVPHCAYYACLLQLKHYLLKQRKCTESELDDEINASNETHQFIIKEFLSLVKDDSKKRSIKSIIGGLKKARVESDYSCKPPIDSSCSSKILSDTKQVITLITSL